MKEPTNTIQQLERNSTNTTANAQEHSPEWLAAFKTQATQDMMDRVFAYVAKRTAWLYEQKEEDEADRLITTSVADALADTFTGTLTWDPMKCPLSLHLTTTVRSRFSNELARAETFRHVDIDDAPEQEVNAALVRQGRKPTKMIGAYAKQFTARLREAAGDDLHVLALIDCYLEDITERGPICHKAQLTPGEYHNAFRRLKRLAEKLPHEPANRGARGSHLKGDRP